MTLIVGLKRNGKLYMAGDRIGVNGHDEIAKVLPKVRKLSNNLGDALIGSCGSMCAHNANEILNLPDHPENLDSLHYVILYVTKAIEKALKASVCWDELDENDKNSTWLFGYQGQLYVIAGPSMQVVKREGDFDTIGSGSPMAIGAMAAASMLGQDLDGQELIDIAMTAVGRNHLYVSPEYTIYSIDQP